MSDLSKSELAKGAAEYAAKRDRLAKNSEAYRKGYTQGLTGEMELSPFNDELLTQSWTDGLRDGVRYGSKL